MSARRKWAAGLLAGLLAVSGVAEGWAREPVATRRLNPGKEPKAARRIEMWRERLDESLQRRYNFAWCIARMEGGERMECIAHSGLGGPEDLSAEAWEAVREVVAPDVPEDARHYETLCVNRRNQIDGDDCWERDQDTEFKILEALTAKLGDRMAGGIVVLYTDLPPCASCSRVIRAFLDRYPNIEMEVLYK